MFVKPTRAKTRRFHVETGKIASCQRCRYCKLPRSVILGEAWLANVSPTAVSGLPARRSEAVALVALLIMSALAIAGPSGLFAWSENLRLRDVRQTRLALLEVERDQLKNRVDLLDPAHSDPDLAGELVRSQMGVVHPDEVVVKIDD